MYAHSQKEGEDFTMENCTTKTPTPVETNESQLPLYTDEEQQNFVQNDYEAPTPVSFFKRRISWQSFIIVMLVLMLIMSSIQVYQYREYGKALEKEAYVVSVAINLLEDNLMFKYGVLPEDLGFEKLRSAWIEDPCYETSMAYYNALNDALDFFEHDNDKPTFTSEPLKV